MAKTIRLFEQASHSVDYSRFRPTYSQSILHLLLGYSSRRGGGGNDLALDLACGSGQSTFYLRHNFQRCLGIDISREQIKQARSLCEEMKVSNVGFQTGDVTYLPLEDSCADLITIATGWHWITNKVAD